MSRRLEIAVGLSVLLHFAVLLWVVGILPGRAPLPDMPQARPMIELRMVERQGAELSTGAPQAARPDVPVAPPPYSPPPGTSPDPSGVEVPDTNAAVAAGQPAPRSSEATEAKPAPSAPAPAAPLEMNLNGTDSDSNAVASGPGIIPAAPDDRARNQPPVYPQEAVRLGQQGAVVLLIHVSADGAAIGSDVVESSGYNSLDQAARQAVARWRFQPGMKDGKPVASDMPMRFVFEFD